MAGFRGKALLAVVLVLGVSQSAQAWWYNFGWRWQAIRAARFQYAYYPVYPAYSVYPVCTTAIPATYAVPQPAPAGRMMAPVAGKSNEPPLADPVRKAPKITESRSMGGTYVQNNGTSKERCKVGFWNLTGRDVTVRIDGQARTLQKDRALTLEVDRSFVWQLDEGQTVAERVPDEQPYHELILRQ